MSSGGHNRRRNCYESQIRIDVRMYPVKSMFSGSCIFTNGWTGEKTEIAISKTKKEYIQINNFEVRLDAVLTNYGTRYYFICPHCWSRVAIVLYYGSGIRCRKCANVNYAIQQESKDIWTEFRRTKEKIEKLNVKLNKKGIHSKTKIRLSIQIETLKRLLDEVCSALNGIIRT